MPQEIRGVLFKNVENRLKPQVVTIRSSIEATCFTKEGINAIKRALNAGLNLSSDKFSIKVCIVAEILFVYIYFCVFI